MTVPAATSRNSYIGNGSVSSYGYGFRVRQAADLRVVVLDLLGNQTLLVLGVDYTLTGIGAANGGLVNLVNASQAWLTVTGKLILNYELTFRRVLALTQNTSIRNQGTFYADVHEDAFDGFTMVDQQLADDISRSVKLPDSSLVANFNPTLPANPPAGGVLAVNSDGTGWDMSTSVAGIQGGIVQFLKAPASGARDGINTTFVLPDVPSPNSMVVAIVNGTMREGALPAGSDVVISAGLVAELLDPAIDLKFLYLTTP